MTEIRDSSEQINDGSNFSGEFSKLFVEHVKVVNFSVEIK